MVLFVWPPFPKGAASNQYQAKNETIIFILDTSVDEFEPLHLTHG